MEAKQIAELLQARPFVPFRITTTRTGWYDLASPEGVLLLETKIYLPVALLNGIAQDVVVIPLAQISSIEPL